MVEAGLGDQGVREPRSTAASDQLRPEPSRALPMARLGMEDRELGEECLDGTRKLGIAEKLRQHDRGQTSLMVRERDIDDPRFGPMGRQLCEDTGPLTKKRMETADEEFVGRAMGFIERNTKAGKPWFAWVSTSRMHFYTHLKEESDGSGASSPWCRRRPSCPSTSPPSRSSRRARSPRSSTWTMR